MSSDSGLHNLPHCFRPCPTLYYDDATGRMVRANPTPEQYAKYEERAASAAATREAERHVGGSRADPSDQLADCTVRVEVEPADMSGRSDETAHPDRAKDKVRLGSNPHSRQSTPQRPQGQAQEPAGVAVESAERRAKKLQRRLRDRRRWHEGTWLLHGSRLSVVEEEAIWYHDRSENEEEESHGCLSTVNGWARMAWAALQDFMEGEREMLERIAE